ncbi:unnamed protein product [Periconia digitata]|uniref:Uncharacterized protein n=1 Tax=Periconia digitata TaxID=1303443 RepID=A0A9W4UM12_9PLEO|nr:unnamed protein product [Periconia digitata]
MSKRSNGSDHATALSAFEPTACPFSILPYQCPKSKTGVTSSRLACSIGGDREGHMYTVSA